ncbi:MAG: CDP-glucose 4,6-dehydratase [Halobacteriovoraceae bacterium]|jgi:CDP-glucose 4,6-dehydratase|nr:CDP-glucose 4,6-dehydratase [Halobacteriovoraceae bacterium]
MEKMVKTQEKLSFYRGKKIFLTGHTGFKGSWMAKWLMELGAEVYGYSLAPPTSPSHFSLLNLDMQSCIEDIRDKVALARAIKLFKPDIIFHLAAQPLVRYSYDNPFETYEVNVMGTLNLLEASKDVDSVRAIVNITTDKCYKNKEWEWGYRESDELGGHDPYSSSKACSEILTESYRNSYFNIKNYGKNHNCLIATARAGNVIGGGDWSTDRIIPDLIKSKNLNQKVHIRNPYAVRPWQHVLEPLCGYLVLGYHLFQGDPTYASSWNFGPNNNQVYQVKDIASQGNEIFKGALNIELDDGRSNLHEAGVLLLDSSRAKKHLHWEGLMDFDTTVKMTFEWYKNFYDQNELNTTKNIEEFTNLIV